MYEPDEEYPSWETLAARVSRLELAAGAARPRKEDGPDVFITTPTADSYPELIEKAEAEARAFYGPDAVLSVERAGRIRSHRTIAREPGNPVVIRYRCDITIRCARLPEGWAVP